METQKLAAEHLALHLARPDIQARLKAGMAAHNLVGRHGRVASQGRILLAGILARARAVAEQISLAGPPEPSTYRLKEDGEVVALAACTCTPIHSDGGHPPIEVNEPSSEDCPVHGRGPTLCEAARELLAPDASVEEVHDIAPDFTLTIDSELPAGTPHHEGLAFSIEGCGCQRCERLRDGAAPALFHETGCQCSPCCRTRLALAELARKWYDTHGGFRLLPRRTWPDQEGCTCEEAAYPIREVTCTVHGAGSTWPFVCTCNPARELTRVGHEADCAMARTVQV